MVQEQSETNNTSNIRIVQCTNTYQDSTVTLIAHCEYKLTETAPSGKYSWSRKQKEFYLTQIPFCAVILRSCPRGGGTT